MSTNTEAFDAIKAMVSGQITEANGIADKVKANRIDVNKTVHEMRTTAETEDEVILKYRKQIDSLEKKQEELTKAVVEHIKASLPKSEMSDEEFDKAKKDYDNLKKAIGSTKKLSANLPGYSEEIFKDLPELKTLAGNTAGTGTGTKRPRLSFLSINDEPISTKKEVKAKDGTVSEVDSYTFTLAAEHINKVDGVKDKVKPSDLSAVAFETAGTDDLSTVDGVEFNYSVNGIDFAFKVNAESGE